MSYDAGSPTHTQKTFRRWNVTYSRIQQISFPYLRSLIEDPEHARLPLSTKGELTCCQVIPQCHCIQCLLLCLTTCAFCTAPGLLIGPQNSLLCFDARTGLQKWSRGFSVPPVAAYPPGASQNVLSGEAAALPTFVTQVAKVVALLQVRDGILSASGSSAGPLDAVMPSEDLGQILVGQLDTGSLYALPASYYDFDLAGPDIEAAAPSGSCLTPGDGCNTPPVQLLSL